MNDTLPVPDLALLVPEPLARFRPLVREAAAYFISRLPPLRLLEAAAAQAALPQRAGVERRLVTALRQFPTLHKLGQVLARERRLPAALRASLQALESLPPPALSGELLDALRRELPRGVSPGRRALAEASVAIVLPVRWREAGQAREGVLKVLKPGIEGRLAEELEAWRGVADFVAGRARRHGLPELDCRSLLEDVQSLLESEVRLQQEQAHLERAARFYRDLPGVVVPGLLPFCSGRVTAMERVRGRKLTEAHLDPAGRARLAALASEALLAQPFFAAEHAAPFHGDPHAGNLFACDDGRLALLDWALVAEVDKPRREAAVQIALAGIMLDERRACRALAAIAADAHEQRVREAVAHGFAPLRSGAFPGLDWLTGLLDGAVLAGAIRPDAPLSLLRKALLTLRGVLADLDPGHSPDAVLLAAGIRQVMSESAQRAWMLPDSRSLASHLSNRDLAELAATAPVHATRLWTGMLARGIALSAGA